ncbi:hypothetical protein SU69_05445 [Thermosipho melanesiensis]|uniref:Glycosyl transferase, group 1 n=2 Tax=Thermosipho melanesiensis TaxID=46541 RepID=A6LLX5_THEM4|nr:glycosyltransferase [Thermosipho melanesiensis]ABR30926.1 hypothetical protein Tmel_1066 [Thermosipho melanesiensis BI429]APT74870.1 hypothetical protein BW47_05705 [Thermosipho melanesiensis]OOC35971.1 hypothetical protein SU68_05505 [Thermosipho melanesiensis]OOC38110.1 hypothetical protein SU69_05445 [Thermosipho melanesiensis]OOC38240.1 hypothetical protein SU70_05455 [Thermosipho melanesiensis]
MKRGIYVVKTDLEKQIGVREKAFSMVEIFSKYSEVLFIYSWGQYVYIDEFVNKQRLKSQRLRTNTLIDKIKSINSVMYSEFRKKVDYIYMRYTISDKSIYEVLKKAKDYKIKTFLEIPVMPYVKELLLQKKYFRFIIDKLIFSKIINYVDYIPTTSEFYLKNENLNNKLIRYCNGVNVNKYPIRKRPPFEDKINILMVTSITFWQGIDRILEGLYNFYKDNVKFKIYLNIVGVGPEMHRLKKMVKKYSLDRFVNFRGKLSGELLDKQFDLNHIAAGSLGRHRTDNNNISTLKASEYCARGIPFFTSVNEMCFNNSLNFIYFVEANDGPIDFLEIINFYQSINSFNYEKEMREYAIENLNWEKVLKEIILRF